MKNFKYFIFYILFLFTSCFLNESLVESKSHLYEETPGFRESIVERSEQLRETPSVLWTWRFLGPDTKPIENREAGRSLSKYSFNRGNGAGKIHRLYIDPSNDNHVFACSGFGGLFETHDLGRHWQIAGTDQLPISGVGCIAVNPHDSSCWVVSTGDPDYNYSFSDGLWLTHNSGKSWVNINGFDSLTRFPVSEDIGDFTYISEVVSDPDNFNRLYVASNKGLFVTDNALDSSNNVQWRLIDDSFYFDIEIPNWNSKEVFASGNRFVVSHDSGATWTKLPLPNYPNKSKYVFLRISMELSDSDRHHIYAAVTNADKLARGEQGDALFQKFDLDSLKWEEVRSLKKNMNNVLAGRARAFEVDPTDSSLILVGNVQPIYRSTDGGINFTAIKKRQMHDDIHHIAFNNKGTTLWVAHDGGVSISFDKGITWEDRDEGIGSAMVYEVSVAQQEEELYLYGGFDTGGNLYKDSIWSHVLWGDGFKSFINYNNPDTMYVSRQNGFIFRSDDRGDHWEGIKPNGIKSPWYSWFEMNTSNPQILYSAGKKISRSFDAGETWEPIFTPSGLDNLVMSHRLFLSSSNPNLMYMNYFEKLDYESPQIFRSFNINEKNPGSVRWEKIVGVPKKGRIASIVPDDINPYKYWLVFQNKYRRGGIFYYDGEHWHDEGEGIGKANIHSLILEKNNNGRVYLGTTYGVFTRDRDDTKWTLLKGLPGTYIRSMTINYVTNKIIVATDGRGLWEGDLFRD